MDTKYHLDAVDGVAVMNETLKLMESDLVDLPVDDQYVEIRARLFDGEIIWSTGAFDYETDHRGTFSGTGYAYLYDTQDDLMRTAQELIAEAIEFDVFDNAD